MTVAELGDEDAERPDADPADEREAGVRTVGPAVRIVADPRDEHDGDDRQPDPDDDQRRGDALEHDARPRPG